VLLSHDPEKRIGEERLMEELVRIVSERTGLPQDTARTAAEAVLTYLKEKLPAPIAGQIDGFLANPGSAGETGGTMGNLGGLFDRK